MFPTLIADDETPNFPPKTDTYLLVGGPKHGERVEIIESDRVYKTFARPMPQPAYMNAPNPASGAFTAPGAFEPTSYLKRDLGIEDPATGERYVRSVFFHEDIPNPEVAQQFLMAALLADFLKGGRRVIDQDGPSNG